MSAWVLGWLIGAGVVVLVVVLLVLMIQGASRAAAKAEAVLAALDDAKVNTLPLWEVDDTNQMLTRIVTAATAAREYLASKAGA